MSVQGPPARVQTIKQAKAAYKARGRPSISEAEKKHLERAAELDRRAWRIKEAEKRRAEAAKKRAESEKKEREGKASMPLGSQRRMDKFGYKSSQMHLGVFLNKAHFKAGEQKENLVIDRVAGVDAFGDDEMDDEGLLEALNESGTTTNSCSDQSRHEPLFDRALQDSDLFQDFSRPHTTLPNRIEDNLDAFLDELGSSTQIARELDADETNPLRTSTYVASLDTDEFDLSDEDLAEMSAIPLEQRKSQRDRKMMSPPSLSAKVTMPAQRQETGFTLNELHDFIDDDLQLTQAAPG